MSFLARPTFATLCGTIYATLVFGMVLSDIGLRVAKGPPMDRTWLAAFVFFNRMGLFSLFVVGETKGDGNHFVGDGLPQPSTTKRMTPDPFYAIVPGTVFRQLCRNRGFGDVWQGRLSTDHRTSGDVGLADSGNRPGLDCVSRRQGGRPSDRRHGSAVKWGSL
jgi:hypothetical protein